MAEKTEKRVKHFAFIIYKENNDKQALCDFLSGRGFTALISPLHSPSGEQGEEKPHYHVLVSLPSPRELSSVNAEFAAVCNKTMAFAVGSAAGYARYCFHLDNPDKEQFADFSGAQLFGGFPLDKYTFREVSQFEVSEFLDYVLYYRTEHKYFCSFIGFLQELREKKLYSYIEYCSRNTYFVQQLLRSDK